MGLINDSNRLPKDRTGICPAFVEVCPTMSRFYFHLSNGVGEIRDEEGADLPDLETARARAVSAIRSILSEELSRGLLDLTGMIHITDDSDQPVLDVRYTEAVEVRYGHEHD